MKNKNYTIPYESLILVQFVIYMYSYNFHSLWIINDAIVLFNLIYVFLNGIYKKYILTFLILSSLLIYLFYFQMNDFKLINFLSFWDDYKHIFLFLFMLHIYKNISEERKVNFINRLYKLSIISFFVQVFFMLIQYKVGAHFDNIAGTFGNGSTHSIAYFSIFLIVLLIRLKKSIYLTLLVLFLSLITSYISENVGFYVMLGLSLFYLLAERFGVLKIALTSFIFISLIFTSLKNEITEDYVDKISGFKFTKKYSGAEKVRAERGLMMGYALFLGGYYGRGFGAYSEIYGKEGWLFHTLVDEQLCISEGTHLVAEIGIIGLFITILLYIVLFASAFKNFKTKMFAISFFILGMFHGRFLLDERIFYFFALTFLVWYSTQNKTIVNG